MEDEEQRELLYRLDERTVNIDEKLDESLAEMRQRVAKNEEIAEAADNRSRKNRTVLNIMTAGTATTLASGWAWLLGLLHIPK